MGAQCGHMSRHLSQGVTVDKVTVDKAVPCLILGDRTLRAPFSL